DVAELRNRDMAVVRRKREYGGDRVVLASQQSKSTYCSCGTLGGLADRFRPDGARRHWRHPKASIRAFTQGGVQCRLKLCLCERPTLTAWERARHSFEDSRLLVIHCETVPIEFSRK